jgi:mRNA-degrading endonuclease toxin of MazEF toxin-antitoxin module
VSPQRQPEFNRGGVWQYGFEEGAAPKPAVIVSANGRNHSRWPVVHIVRVATAPKDERPTVIPVPGGECVKGSILCDELYPAYKEDLGKQLGALSPGVMRQVDNGLRAMLGLA